MLTRNIPLLAFWTTNRTKKSHYSPKLCCTCQRYWKTGLLCLTQLLLTTASRPCGLTNVFSLWGSEASLLLLSGRMEKCTVRSPLLSNTEICSEELPTLRQWAVGSWLSNFVPDHFVPAVYLVYLVAEGWDGLRSKPANGTRSRRW